MISFPYIRKIKNRLIKNSTCLKRVDFERCIANKFPIMTQSVNIDSLKMTTSCYKAGLSGSYYPPNCFKSYKSILDCN